MIFITTKSIFIWVIGKIGRRQGVLMKKFFSLVALLALGTQAQDIVEIAPFWAAYDALEPEGINDLYNDLNLPDTMKKFGQFPVTWESSDTLLLGHDGKINGRFVGENKEVILVGIQNTLQLNVLRQHLRGRAMNGKSVNGKAQHVAEHIHLLHDAPANQIHVRHAV